MPVTSCSSHNVVLSGFWLLYVFPESDTQVLCVCRPCVKQWTNPAAALLRISWGTVAGRGTVLQSHASRQLAAHAYTHTHTSHRAAVMMCRAEVLKHTDMHQEADVFFRLMSSYFSVVTAKICLSPCLSLERLPCPACARAHLNFLDTLSGAPKSLQKPTAAAAAAAVEQTAIFTWITYRL